MSSLRKIFFCRIEKLDLATQDLARYAVNLIFLPTNFAVLSSPVHRLLHQQDGSATKVACLVQPRSHVSVVNE